jgi:probable H4MPT-linked C1 transfer pathway protein
MKWLGLDIGGANIKVADGHGFAESHHFALWLAPERLAETLRAAIALAPRADHLAVTMTGELADCFSNKVEGVEHIVRAIVEAADGRHTRIYLTNGRLVAPPIALRQPLLAAASNWHALASFAGRFVQQGTALLVDIGSTTCDLIPLVDGTPRPMGATDVERLASGELVYTGVERSPICALVSEATWRGQTLPVAQELFATAWDAYLTLGDLAEEPRSLHTADGRPATRQAAHARLARTICADADEFSVEDVRLLSEIVAEAQLKLVHHALVKVLSRSLTPPSGVIVSGQGEFLARRALVRIKMPAPVISLTSQLDPAVSRAATAHAVAVLAEEGSRG